MPQPLRAVDPGRDHPRDLARRAVKQFRLDRDDPEHPLPISNRVDSGAPLLNVNAVIKRTQRDIPMEPERHGPVRIRGYVALAIALAAGAFGLVIVIAEALK